MPPLKPKPGLPPGNKPTPVPRRSAASDSGETGMQMQFCFYVILCDDNSVFNNLCYMLNKPLFEQIFKVFL